MKIWLVAACFLAGGYGATAAEVDFAHDVAPILKQHCSKCHTGEKREGGLSLDTRETLLAGGESGRAVVMTLAPR